MKIILMEDCPISLEQAKKYIPDATIEKCEISTLSKYSNLECVDVIISGDKDIPSFSKMASLILAISDSLPKGAHNFLPIKSIERLNQEIHLLREKKLEQEVCELNKQLMELVGFASLGEVMADIIHWMNNPLGVILGFTQSIMERLGEESSVYSDLSLIEKEIRRFASQLRNLMDIARRPADTLFPQNIPDVIDASLGLLQDHIRRNKITLERNIPTNIGLVYTKNLQRILFLYLLLGLKKAGELGSMVINAYDADKEKVTISLSAKGRGTIRNSEYMFLKKLVDDTDCQLEISEETQDNIIYTLNLPQWR